MNNIQKGLLGLALGLALIGIYLPLAPALGGVSNFDSLQLQSAVSGDNALDVRNTSGTSRFVVSGSGVITISGDATLSGVNAFSGASTFSSSLTATGESRINRVRDTGSVLSPAPSSVVTLTVAQFGDSSLVRLGDWAPAASGTAVLNLPVAEGVFSDCLTTDGDSFSFVISNLASASGSSTLITVGSASTTLFGFDTAEDVLLGGSRALIKVWRASSTAMHVSIDNFVEAD